MPIAKLFDLSGPVALATGGSVRHVPWPKPGLRSPSLLVMRRRTNVSLVSFKQLEVPALVVRVDVTERG